MTKKVDIIILSGFLGSGKSTLLKELINFEKSNGKKIGVLMNELGDISIDSAIVPDDTLLKEMLNGCICCTIQGELSLQLSNMLFEYELDVIYIEATGAAHPLEVVDACTHPMLASKVFVRAVITVVNAIQWLDNKLSIKLKKLLIEQVKYADIVLINKMDQIREDDLQQIEKDIEEKNDLAIILATTFTKMDSKIIYEHRLGKGDNRMLSTHESHVHTHLNLRTMSFPIQKPIDRLQFENWLKNMEGKLYRAKGFLYLKETLGLFLFNYAYGDPMFERYPVGKNYEPILIFIGEELDWSQIEKGIQNLQL